MRSTKGGDYQFVPRPVAVMAKTFENGASTGEHNHPRGQVLYATTGLMLARTRAGAWAVPSGHALLIPPLLSHDIGMHGCVEMLTAYIAPEIASALMPGACRVIQVTKLLDALLQATVQEPLLYEEDHRGGHLAELILDEVKNAKATALALPIPSDPRVHRMCRHLIDDPGSSLSIDVWADEIGVSRRTLTRRIRQETGLSSGEWCRRLRYLRTIALKAEGTPIKLVAAQVGYQSPQALLAMMKRATARKGDI
jgi:AraC-like DNA-binding protein